jgi:hypothetical protein
LSSASHITKGESPLFVSLCTSLFLASFHSYFGWSMRVCILKKSKSQNRTINHPAVTLSDCRIYDHAVVCNCNPFKLRLHFLTHTLPSCNIKKNKHFEWHIYNWFLFLLRERLLLSEVQLLDEFLFLIFRGEMQFA